MLGIDTAEVSSHRAPWNKGRLIGQKRPLKPKEVWAIRVRLQLEERRRDLALFNLALDSKLRGCDLVLAPGQRRVRRGPSPGPRHGSPAENRQTGPVRNH
jgi:hypothetical protein